MRSVNIHEAKTHFSGLVREAAKGETIIVAKAGRPVAKLTAFDAVEPAHAKRTGFLRGQAVIPDDFDEWGREEVSAGFEAGA